MTEFIEVSYPTQHSSGSKTFTVEDREEAYNFFMSCPMATMNLVIYEPMMTKNGDKVERARLPEKDSEVSRG